jgi:hypothetical protein
MHFSTSKCLHNIEKCKDADAISDTSTECIIDKCDMKEVFRYSIYKHSGLDVYIYIYLTLNWTISITERKPTYCSTRLLTRSAASLPFSFVRWTFAISKWGNMMRQYCLVSSLLIIKVPVQLSSVKFFTTDISPAKHATTLAVVSLSQTTCSAYPSHI